MPRIATIASFDHLHLIIPVLIFISTLGILACSGSRPQTDQKTDLIEPAPRPVPTIEYSGNKPPIIQKIAPSGITVPVGKIVEFNIEAIDPDNDPLDITWSADRGEFIQNKGLTATWMASDDPGWQTIKIIVADPNGAKVAGSTRVNVIRGLIVPADTAVSVKVLQPVNSKTARVGDKYPVQVVQDVICEGKPVLEEGAFGIAEVTFSEPPGFAGKPGEIHLAITKVQTSDGQLVPLNAQISGQGKPGSSAGVQTLFKAAGAIGLAAGVPIPYAAAVPFLIPVLTSGKPGIIPEGTLLRGSTISDLLMKVTEDGIEKSPQAKEPPVMEYACLGMLVESYSDLTLTLHKDGVKITQVQKGSAAEKAGIDSGDRITEIVVRGSRHRVRSQDDLDKMIQLLPPGEEVTLRVRNVLHTADVAVPLDRCYHIR